MSIRRIDLTRHGNGSREGLLIALTDDAGRVGFGEASPLPGYSPDTLEACHAALSSLRPSALCELEANGPDLLAELRAGSAAIDFVLPAARHALETALLDLLAQRRDEPLWALCARAAGLRDVPSLVPLAALIEGADTGALVAAAESAVARGVRTIKLKLGRTAFDTELARARAVRDALGPAIELRLDVNRRWLPAHATNNLAALAQLRPELVEESVPLARLSELVDSPVPLALDESLQAPGALDSLRAIDPACRVVALVLKPMTLGGFARCVDLASFARRHGLDVIISHVFDGPVALAAAAHLALAIGSPNRAAGLAPHSGLAAWPQVAVPLIHAAHVIADDAPGLGIAPLAA